MVNQDRIIEKFIEYVKVSSESRDEIRFQELLLAELKDMGFEIFLDESIKEKSGSNASNIIARYTNDPSEDYIMLSAHMDTVTPGNDIKPVIEGDYIKSDGSTILGGDDKGGIITIMEAVRTLKEHKLLMHNIEIVFTICEEVGLLGSKYLDYEIIKSKKAIVLDSSGQPGNIIVKGPGQNKIDFKITGKTAHAGICPEEGISAIQIASEAISNMNLLRIDEETTANIGKISGGSATNIVCDSVVVNCEARSLSLDKLQEQTDHMVEEMKKACEKFGGKLDFEVTRSYNPLVVDENSELVKEVSKAMEQLDISPLLKASGGGSDTNNYFENGIEAINLAVGMTNVHTKDECIKISDLVKMTELIIELIKK